MLWRSPEPSDPSAVSDEDACCAADIGNEAVAPPGRLSRLREATRYGFVTMVDEIGFWLVIGIVITGAITALVPAAAIQDTLGDGPTSHMILLLLGVPLYMCASASTPVGAALLLKGVSPGAALVFLLAGPATNASSLVVIARFFGRRFVAIYLFSVVLTALITGWLFDYLLDRADWQIVPTLAGDHTDHVSAVGLASALGLGLLLHWSIARGSWKTAIQEVVRDLKSWRQLLGR